MKTVREWLRRLARWWVGDDGEAERVGTCGEYDVWQRWYRS